MWGPSLALVYLCRVTQYTRNVLLIQRIYIFSHCSATIVQLTTRINLFCRKQSLKIQYRCLLMLSWIFQSSRDIWRMLRILFCQAAYQLAKRMFCGRISSYEDFLRDETISKPSWSMKNKREFFAQTTLILKVSSWIRVQHKNLLAT